MPKIYKNLSKKAFRKRLFLFSCLLYSLAFVGCSSSNDDAGGGVAGGPGTAAMATGAASLTSAGALAGLNTTLTESLVPTNDEDAEKSSGVIMLSGSSQSDEDPLCSTVGMPWDSDSNSEMQADNEDFPFAFYHCQTSPAGIGPDSAYGAMGIAQMFLCSVESSLPGLTYDGEEINGENLRILSGCLTTAMLNDEEFSNYVDLPLGPDVKITASEMPGASGWDRKIAVEGIHLDEDDPTDVMDFTVYYRNDAQVTAVKFVEVNDPDGANVSSGWSFTIDRENSRLLFETFAPQFQRHIRFLAEGAISANGFFSQVNKIEGAYTQGQSGETVKAATVIGSITNNFAGRRFFHNGGWTNESECLGVSATPDCSGLTPVDFATRSDANDFGVTGGTDISAFLNEGGASFNPLSFSSVNGTRMPTTDSYRD